MTGRAAGLCAGFGVPGCANPIPGRGLGFGRGRGFRGGGFGGGEGWGRRNMFWATGMPGWMRFGAGAGVGTDAPLAEPTPEAERNFLKLQSDALQAQLDEVRKRLEQLEPEKAQK
jgi:hypothetical protein